MAPQAPSEGQKVDLGRNAPIKNEGTGNVQTKSLAAESYREGGGFSSNTNAQPENLSSPDYTSKSSGTTKLGSREGLDASYSGPGGVPQDKSYAGEAPSYVNTQFIKDSSGPHGKNIQEGFDDAGLRDGLKAALASEPGSKNDPSRLAEQQFERSQNAPSNGAGPKDTSLSKDGQFDALKQAPA